MFTFGVRRRRWNFIRKKKKEITANWVPRIWGIRFSRGYNYDLFGVGQGPESPQIIQIDGAAAAAARGALAAAQDGEIHQVEESRSRGRPPVTFNFSHNLKSNLQSFKTTLSFDLILD